VACRADKNILEIHTASIIRIMDYTVKISQVTSSYFLWIVCESDSVSFLCHILCALCATYPYNQSKPKPELKLYSGRQHPLPKHSHPPIRLHNITTQNTIIRRPADK
jgi:hypothetical protein